MTFKMLCTDYPMTESEIKTQIEQLAFCSSCSSNQWRVVFHGAHGRSWQELERSGEYHGTVSEEMEAFVHYLRDPAPKCFEEGL